MSVKRKVTVPVGSACIANQGDRHVYCRGGSADAQHAAELGERCEEICARILSAEGAMLIRAWARRSPHLIAAEQPPRVTFARPPLRATERRRPLPASAAHPVH